MTSLLGELLLLGDPLLPVLMKDEPLHTPDHPFVVTRPVPVTKTVRHPRRSPSNCTPTGVMAS